MDTYNYILPKELIAQYPSKKRDESRLLCYKKSTKEISHHIFHDLSTLLTNNDVLVLNNTKVIPARFFAKTENDKEVEILLVRAIGIDNLVWKVLGSPRKQLEKTKSLTLTPQSPILSPQSSILNPTLSIQVIDQDTIRFKEHKDLEFVLNNVGQMPLPPYIKRGSEEVDIDRYQTVFAQNPGAVAAPTASLHFTEDLLNKIKSNGTEVLFVTLHVGPGTFLPIRSNDIREHMLIPESYYIESETWGKISNAKKNKKRIVACGSTTVRALEYAHMINKFSGLTSLFITPEFKFQIVDSMITNFHLPKTTLLVLVSALAGWENIKTIYEEAIKEKYRFYSYGDAMMIS